MTALFNKIVTLYRNVAQKEKTLERIDFILKILLLILIMLFFTAQVKNIYKIPVNKPYYNGHWDEPFALNAGINALYNNGNPIFYNYGGTCVYPSALVMYLYGQSLDMSPYYQLIDKKFGNPHFPVTRRIYPTKAIYITQIVAYIMFLLAALAFTALFSYYLLPVPFWLIPSIMMSGTFGHYASTMLPEIHIGLLSGITCVFFAMTLLEEDQKKYYKYLLICAVFASLTVGAKINTLYIVLLPVSLLWKPFKEKYLNSKRIAALAGGLALPYILVNPAIIFNTGSYFSWLLEMRNLSEIKPQLWMTRIKDILPFVRDIHLLNLLPAALLIALFILTVILMAKNNPPALFGFLFFLFYSFQSIANMSHDLYPRHFGFLLMPLNLLILFPLIYIYRKSTKPARTVFTFMFLLVTLWMFPPQRYFGQILDLKNRQFTTDWKRESRDRLIDFVKEKDAVLYFYDVHGFSLPYTISNKIIPFSNPDELPPRLDSNTYIAFIQYKSAPLTRKNASGKYNRDVQALQQKYKPVKIFGPPGGSHNINNDAPVANPTIVLMKEK
jgi:hypothetical protein